MLLVCFWGHGKRKYSTYPTVLQVQDNFHIFLSVVKMSNSFKIKKVSIFTTIQTFNVRIAEVQKREAKGAPLLKSKYFKFAGHRISIATAQCCSCGRKATIDSVLTKGVAVF